MGVLESFAIDHNSGLPVWIQIKNRIAYLIGSGAFVPGDRLPTVRALAVDLDISYNTVNRAYMDLEREGYISTRKGRGTFVAERHDLGAHTASDSPIELVIDDMIRVCSNAGLADDDIVAMVQARLAHREFRPHLPSGARARNGASTCAGNMPGQRGTSQVFIVARYCDNVTL